MTILFNSIVGFTINTSTKNLVATLITNQKLFEEYIELWIPAYRIIGICGLLTAAMYLEHVVKILLILMGLQIVSLLVIISQRSKFKNEKAEEVKN